MPRPERGQWPCSASREHPPRQRDAGRKSGARGRRNRASGGRVESCAGRRSGEVCALSHSTRLRRLGSQVPVSERLDTPRGSRRPFLKSQGCWEMEAILKAGCRENRRSVRCVDRSDAGTRRWSVKGLGRGPCKSFCARCGNLWTRESAMRQVLRKTRGARQCTSFRATPPSCNRLGRPRPRVRRHLRWSWAMQELQSAAKRSFRCPPPRLQSPPLRRASACRQYDPNEGVCRRDRPKHLSVQSGSPHSKQSRASTWPRQKPPRRLLLIDPSAMLSKTP